MTLTRINPTIGTVTRRLAALAAVSLMAACAQVAPVSDQVPAAPDPAASAVPAVPRVAPLPAPVAPPVTEPARPAAPTGPVDSRSGLHQAAVISITGDADSRFTVLFRPGQTEASRIEAAPAQLCSQAGRSLKDSRTNKPGAGSAMPGVQMMIVTCSAA